MKQLMTGVYVTLVAGCTIWAGFDLWNEGFSPLWNGDVPTPNIAGPLTLAIFVVWGVLIVVLAVLKDPVVNYDTQTGVIIAAVGTLLAYMPYAMLLRQSAGHNAVWSFSLTIPFTDVLLTPTALLIAALAFFHAFFVELLVFAPEVKTVHNRT
jgi:hypothetical protein